MSRPATRSWATITTARNEHILLPGGKIIESEDVLGWYQITKQYYERYKKPVMYTETNDFDPEKAPTWLWKQWINILKMRKDGVPVLGFTWYSLIDQVDWDIELAEKRGVINACGLYDMQRRPRPVAARVSSAPGRVRQDHDRPARRAFRRQQTAPPP